MRKKSFFNKITIPFLLIIFFAEILVYLYFIPNLLYILIIKGYYEPSWYKVKNRDPEILSGNYFLLEKFKRPFNLDNRFKYFHIHDYQIELPIEHPQYFASPIILEEEGKNNPLQLGVKFLTIKQEILNEITFNKRKTIKRMLRSSPFFQFPIVWNWISDKHFEEIFKDLFLLDLDIDSYINTIKLDFQQLAYNMYILVLRNIYFSNKMIKISYNEDNNAGVVEFDTNDDQMIWEEVMFLRGHKIDSYTIRTKKDDDLADHMRVLTIKTAYYQLSNLKEGKEIYDKFLKLPYSFRIEQQGLLYLWSAWSQDTANKDYLKEILRYLKRGDENITVWSAFENLANKRYGINFSKEVDQKDPPQDEAINNQTNDNFREDHKGENDQEEEENSSDKTISYD